MRKDLIEVLNALYKSEINVTISSFWDGGWTIKLGDEMNGFKAERTFSDLQAAGPWLIDEARRAYPNSEFAKAH